MAIDFLYICLVNFRI